MRTIWRTLDRASARDIALLCAADTLVAVSFGAIATGAGLPLWLPMALSLLVFAGASQFVFIGLLAAGAGPVGAVVAGLLVNARHLPFGFAVADSVRGRLGRTLVGSHLVLDETVAFTMTQDDPHRRRIVYWACGTALFVTWNLGVLLGLLGGGLLTDTAAFGLDAALPAVLLALVIPELRKERATWRAAVAGAAIALAVTPFVPAGLPALFALGGLVMLLPGRWR
ncbi:AzlC family ABC transporter permease [Rhodococcus sp. D2-41]|uniref:AzlC family ABC transporter permease n=1 Tax=Speluncibacter jeojiensis TaxID=2710754 RepID=UPI00240FA70E|nr:AzlC family ABC transporter permease [Rhodococcus sp. D2-41]MDG3009618.1 AzlC family ABC transporter permease [Rhodococcus sp. D2-41]